MKKFAVALSIILISPGLAWANNCPGAIQKAENMMNRNLKLDTMVLGQILSDLLKARKLHETGKHTEAQALVNAAMLLMK